jgi:small subunit ribosomal protein S17
MAEDTAAVEAEFIPAKRRLTKVGLVVSDKSDKTVVVAVENRRRHPLYRKTVARTKKFHAHDENNECIAGDIVRIEESRPRSKLKRWVVREIVERAERDI